MSIKIEKKNTYGAGVLDTNLGMGMGIFLFFLKDKYNTLGSPSLKDST